MNRSRMYEATLEQLDLYERSLDTMSPNELRAFWKWVMDADLRTDPRAWEIHLTSKRYR